MGKSGIILTQEQQDKMLAQEFGDGGTVYIEDFVRVRGKSQPTSGFGIAVFFVQTFALLAKDAEFFGAADVLNLDSEKAMGACVSPLTYHERFTAKMIITPFIMFIGVPLMVPVWNLIRSNGPQNTFDKMNLPKKITKTHLQRGLLNAFLFVFAPLTREAVQALVCIETCSDDGPDCKTVLAFDQGVVCFEDEHLTTALLAVGMLIALVVLFPLTLIKKVGHARLKRDLSLNLKIDEVSTWFEEIDEDGGGELDKAEIKLLLKRMGEGTGKKKFAQGYLIGIPY